MLLPPATKAQMLLGQCIPCIKQGASKFKIRRLELDTNLNMFFPKHEVVYAHDPEKICKTGDMVIIECLPQKLTRLITHKVKEVLYPLGDLTDPVTNKKIVSSKFREDIDDINRLYGENEGAFRYAKAPRRGWQENKKDFTHVDIRTKYHDDGRNDPTEV
ncbi:unnamed protein product [Phyllotreta striolata]|uniref:Ribosomal protein S17 n=1 Tax=Phyllotreta striolata TaxID=444603 RepID=A0A9N9XN78_PHYSR|nr:unnamed protein product [Phyllotreta striolata]